MALRFDSTIRALKGLVYKSWCRGDIERYMALRAWAMQLATSINLYERRAISALPLLLKAGDNAIDIGANFGGYTPTLSKLVGASGQVWAFEPIPGVFNQLKLRTKNLSNVRLFNLALSNRAQEALTLHIPLLSHGAPEPSLASIEELAPPCQKITIKVECLDALSPQLTALAFIKIDVEGHESACLEGAVETIARLKPVIQFEENDLVGRFDWFKGFAERTKMVLKYFSNGRFHPLVSPDSAPRNERNFYLFSDF